MMKKLLVLTLVLGMASLASAGLSLNPSGEGTQTLGIALIGQDYTTAQPATAFLAFTDPVSNVAFLYAGDDPSTGITDQPGFVGPMEGILGVSLSSVYQVVIQDVDPFDDIPNGDLVTFDMSGGSVYLQDATGMNTLAMYTVVPEPATLALLGLGALVLRRKK